ncbi:DUF3616 domain-containing protein [candidate division KSB1 bacterium]|nr:DUF3616 domain-containing protein [candidate division KSB1 bacterium]
MRSCAEVATYYGMCDASAALGVGEEHFIIANDEDNILRLYHIDKKLPVRTFDLTSFFKIRNDDKRPESDIEGAAKLDDYNFFITSHGRDKKGRMSWNRHQFFAVRIDPRTLQIEPVGVAYRDLLDDIFRLEAVKKLSMEDSYLPQEKRNDQLAPKERGVNIEGLAAAPNGRSLLIGFRNPIPGGRALVIELLNPVAVVAESQPPKFGETFLLDMGNRGVRSIEFDPLQRCYLVIGGPADDEIDAKLYVWDGLDSAPVEIESIDFSRFEKFTPEALFFSQQNSVLQIFSDDGTIKKINAAGDKCDCKDLGRDEEKSFRDWRIEREALR